MDQPPIVSESPTVSIIRQLIMSLEQSPIFDTNLIALIKKIVDEGKLTNRDEFTKALNSSLEVKS